MTREDLNKLVSESVKLDLDATISIINTYKTKESTYSLVDFELTKGLRDFLISKGLLDTFLKRLDACDNSFFKDDDLTETIDSFLWASTPEGYCFWQELQEEFISSEYYND